MMPNRQIEPTIFLRVFFWLAVMCLVALPTGWMLPASAQVPGKVATKPAPESTQEAAQKKANQQTRALERKVELLEFVESHEPQVKSLLAMLESKRPEQFRSALAGLAREVDRLKAVEKRDPQRFEIELRAWKNNQQIQIATAKISLRGETPELRNDLSKLVLKRSELRKQALQLELNRITERAEKISQQLAKNEEQSDSELEKQVEQLISKSRRTGNNKEKHFDAKTSGR